MNTTLVVTLIKKILNRDTKIIYVDYSRILKEVLRSLKNVSLSGRY